jgi:hypothetical protein
LLATPGATPGPLIDLWIAGAYLAAIIPAGTAPVAAGVQTLDAASCLAVPGLVNAHTHWYTALLADTVPGAPLDLFVLEAMARLAPRSPRMVYVSALVHGLLLLKRGVTGLVDHVRHGVLPSVEAYCGATPTECVPFLGKDVSSMINQASSPPICASASVSKAVSNGAASQTPLETKWCNWS